MTNHYHVVVETVEGNLSQDMRQLNGVCTQRFNRAHRSAMTEIPRIQRRPLAKSLEHYRDTMADPKAAMVTAYATGDHTMQEIALFFGVHYATVSRAVKKHGTEMRDCKT